MYRFGLPPESIKSRLVEVSGGKAWFPSGREAPRTIIEAFAGHVDIVAVEHDMNKARRHIGCREVSRIFHYLAQQGEGWGEVRVRITDQIGQALLHPLRHHVLVAFDSYSLKCPDTGMTMSAAYRDRGSGGRRLRTARPLPPGLEIGRAQHKHPVKKT